MTLKDSLTIAGGRGVRWGFGGWLGNLKSWGQITGKLPWIWTLESSCYDSWSLVPVSLGGSEQRKAFTALRLTPWCCLFGRSVVSGALWPHGLQHARFPCSSLSPTVCSDSRPLSWWCHPIISSSVIPFSSCPQSFPASGYFPMNRFSKSRGQSTGASASASVLPMNI